MWFTLKPLSLVLVLFAVLLAPSASADQLRRRLQTCNCRCPLTRTQSGVRIILKDPREIAANIGDNQKCVSPQAATNYVQDGTGECETQCAYAKGMDLLSSLAGVFQPILNRDRPPTTTNTASSGTANSGINPNHIAGPFQPIGGGGRQ